ncbi:MAG: SMP-30/gluconolactonase/LRE family protein, partial [Verrucomicrobia bacterium]|nr:SMP-30/gluconolactonase/LRE family protein [Verrucomicrobiota bacterium]
IIYKYDISSDKGGISLSNKQVFCKDQSDGLTLDDQGNLYLTNGRGVVVYDKTGKEIEVIRVPEGWTANVCFGGKNHDVLFITASKGLYSIHLKYKGANPNK